MAIYINTFAQVVKAKLVIRQLLSGFKTTSMPNINTLRTRSFKLFKRPFPGFLTILTL